MSIKVLATRKQPAPGENKKDVIQQELESRKIEYVKSIEHDPELNMFFAVYYIKDMNKQPVELFTAISDAVIASLKWSNYWLKDLSEHHCQLELGV